MSSLFILDLPQPVGEPATSVTPAGQIDHAQAAENRLIQRFKKPKMRAFIRAYCKPMAALEQAIADLLTKRTVETATGAQLLVLARIVGQPVLAGLSEEDLRRYVRARIRANRSSGTGPDIIAITRLIVNDPDTEVLVRTVSGGVANVTLRNNPTDFDISRILFRDFLVKAMGIGVRIELEWEPADSTDTFEFESFTPPTGPGKGWGDAIDPDVGGEFASAFVSS